MKNREYWQRRFLALESDQVKNSKKLVERLEKEWFKTTKEIEKEITSWYNKFAKDNNMDMATAKSMLSFGELKEFKWNVEDYITKAKENVLNGNWEKELGNAYAKQRISRLQAIDIQLRERIEELYNKEYVGIKDLAENVYTDTYYKSIFEIDKGFGVGSSFNMIDNRRIEKVLATGWTSDNRTFSDRIWTAKEKLISTLQIELTQNIIMGAAPDRFIKALAKTMNTGKNEAARLVMTESAFFYSAAQKEAYSELEVEKYEYLATLDMNTSELCQSMDGQVFDMKDYKVGVTAPPLHPWCRSVTVPYFADSFGERFARGEDGKTYTVPEDMAYKEWKDEFASDGLKNDFNKNVVLPYDMIKTKGLSEDIKEKIKSTIESMQNEYIIKIDEIAYIDISKQGKVPLQFNPVNNKGVFKSQLIINSGYDWNDTLDDLNARIYNKNYKTGKLASKNLDDLVRHEMCHFMTFQDCKMWVNFENEERFVRREFISGVSLYNDVCEDGAETIAEGFVAMQNSEDVPEKIRALVNEYIMRWKR